MKLANNITVIFLQVGYTQCWNQDSNTVYWVLESVLLITCYTDLASLRDKVDFKSNRVGLNLVVQWLRICFTGMRNSIPDPGTNIPHDAGQLSSHTTARESLCATTKTQGSQKKKKKVV